MLVLQPKQRYIMNKQEQQLYNKTCAILRKFCSNATELRPNTKLMYDLEMDSLELAFLFIELEKQFNLTNPSIHVSEMQLPFLTVERLVKLIVLAQKQNKLSKSSKTR